MTLKISVTTQGEQEIRLIVKDWKQANTVLTDRVKTINGTFEFIVRLPLCRKKVIVEIFNNADGSDSSFKYNGYVKAHLETRFNLIDYNNRPKLNEFMRFAQKFCYNAGMLAVNDRNDPKSVYHSGTDLVKGFFEIKYLPTIIGDEGEELTTPARISMDVPLIEISQKYFINDTVPMRMATLCHEYSHPFANEDPDSEAEADINGLLIYLAYGFPRVDAAEAWCETFNNYPSEENMERIQIIRQFIEDFEKDNKVFFVTDQQQ